MMKAHNRCSALLLGVVLVLVSPCDAFLASCNHNFRTSCSSTHLVSDKYENQQQRDGFCHITSISPVVLSMSSQVTATGDNQEIRELFKKYCDEDSRIDRKMLESMPPFDSMLADEDLLPSEMDEIWEAVLKSSDDSSRADIDSFVQIYRDIDDLFEDEDEDVDGSISEPPITETPLVAVDDNGLDEELSNAFKSICDDSGLISKDKMKGWEEIESLFEEGLLGEDEFEELWGNAVKKEDGMMDAVGFSSFNVALDDLFVLDDEDDEDGDDNNKTEEPSATAAPPRAMVVEGDMPPGVLFSQLANENNLVGKEELNLWTELKEMLDDGELLESELQEIYDKFSTADSSGKLTEDAFLQLYDEIDTLFEEIDDDDDAEEVVPTAPAPAQIDSSLNQRVKDDLLAFIDIVLEEDEEPCGFGASEADQKQINNIVQVLEKQPTNMIVAKEGNVERFDLAGNWELIYTSSSAMKFNQGLSGIGGSWPNGKFGGVRQELKATKFLSDMEYKERIEVTPAIASFDVSVNGLWDLQKSVSLFTGQLTVILQVEPDRVTYGGTSTRADHWKSLGPVNRLDLSYLDDDMRVMRGCTSSDTLFIFRKIK